MKEKEKTIAQSEKPHNPAEVKRPAIEEDEIDLIEVARTIWASRRLIIKVTVIFFILGIIVAFGSKVEYEASTELLPESQEGIKPNLGGLGGLAGLAGINLDVMSSQGTIPPNLYPEIVQSFPFQLDIIYQDIHFEIKDTTVSSYNYFKEIDSPSLLSYLLGYTIGLPSKIKNLIFEEAAIDSTKQKGSDSNIIKLTKEEFETIYKFKERINVTVDEETGIITLTTEMPDPNAAAELADKSVKLLQQRITEYKINKAKQNLKFIRERFEEAKINFQKVQKTLATFNDRHRNVVTAMAKTEEQRLQNEYDVAFEVYKGLASQLEQAEIKVKEETPVFTVVEPVKVPLERSKPKRKIIVFIATFLGFLIAVIVAFIMYYIKYFREKSDFKR